LKRSTYFLFAFLFLLSACAKQPYRAANRDYKRQAKQYARVLKQYPLRDSSGLQAPERWVGTTNFSMRKPNFVVIHHTAQESCPQTLRTFTLERTKVSAHYVICEDGTVHHMLNDYLRAWHAGLGRWGNTTDLNSCSIGIELDNNGAEPFPEAQMQALYALLDRLKNAYGIPPANFIGHADLAPTRKNDPSVFFDWKTLADKGFGQWYGDTTAVALPLDFNPVQALRIVGYDLKDTAAVVRTFRRKYFNNNEAQPLAESEKKALYLLMLKNM
jgi:N-acetylmuramoyl-L-alanine amidase